MAYIQLGNQIVSATELPHLLAEYQLLSQFQRELIVNKAIATIELTPEEKANSIGYCTEMAVKTCKIVWKGLILRCK